MGLVWLWGGFVERGGDDWDWDCGLWLDGFMGCGWGLAVIGKLMKGFFWGSGSIIGFFNLGVCMYTWTMVAHIRISLRRYDYLDFIAKESFHPLMTRLF